MSLINKKAIRRIAHGHNKKVSREFYDALERRLRKIIEEACHINTASKRTILHLGDLYEE